MKLSVVYYSATGTVDAMARKVAAAAEAAGAEVRLRHVAELAPQEAIESQDAWAEHRKAVADEPEATAEDLVWADAVIMGTPTRFGNVSSQLKQFIDTLGGEWGQGKLANKAYAGFTSSQTAHGGQEQTLTALYTTFMHWGGIIVAPGYTDGLTFVDGNPYGVGHVTGANNDAPLDDAANNALEHLAQRVVKIGSALAG